MKRKILSMMLAICMVVSIVAVFPAAAVDSAYILPVCGDTTVLDHLKYSNAYNSNTGKSGAGSLGADGGTHIIFRTNDFIEYTLDVKESGYYNLGFVSTAHNINLQRWDAYVDGVKQIEFATWYGTWNDVVGDLYLEKGIRTLKFVVTAGHNWKYFEGLSLTRKIVQERAHWIVGKDYSATDGRLEADKLVLAGGKYGEYKVTVPESGTYLMSIQHHYNYHSLTSTVTVNGTTTYTGANLTGAYSADATRTSEYMMSPVAMIKLNAGENTVRYTNTTPSNAFYVRALTFEKSGGAVKSAINYDAVSGSTGPEGGALKLGYGLAASYNLNIEEDGAYAVSVYSGSTANSYGEYSVLVDGGFRVSRVIKFPDWKGATKHLLGIINLEAGERTISFRTSYNTSTHYFKTFVVEKVSDTKVLTADNATVIEDEITNVVDAENYVNDCSHDAFALDSNGFVTVAPSGEAAYKVNVLRDGIYTLKFKYNTAVNGMVVNTNLDGVTELSSYLQATGAGALKNLELGDLTLTKGVHEIEFINANSMNGFTYPIYLSEFTLERKERPSESIWTWARIYSNIVDGKAGDALTNVEGPGIALRSTDTAEYTVVVPEAGVYRFDALAGNGTLTYDIFVDGEKMNWVSSSVLSKRYTAGLEDQVCQPICDVYFEEAGTHTVSILNNGGAHYFYGFKLDKLAGLDKTSIMYHATDYIEAYDATTGQTTAGVEGGNVTLGNGDTLTYDASVYEGAEGWYNVYMLGSRDGFNKSDIYISVNGKEVASGRYNASGSFSALNECLIGRVYLPVGSNTVKLRQTVGGAFYFYAIVLEPVEFDDSTVVSGKETFVNLQPMLGEQEGGESMAAGYYSAVRVFEGKTVSYDLDVYEAGKYNVYVTTSKDHMIADTIYFDVTDGEKVNKVAISNPHKATYPLVNAGTFDFAEGKTTLSFEAAQDFALGEVLIEKINDVEFGLNKVDGEIVYVANAIGEGDYEAKVTFNNGAYEGKEMILTFAVYETDASGAKKLYKVSSQIVTAEDGTVTLPVDDISLEDGKNYTTRCYAWEKATLCGQSRGF